MFFVSDFHFYYNFKFSIFHFSFACRIYSCIASKLLSLLHKVINETPLNGHKTSSCPTRV